MRISDWSSDVCSSDLLPPVQPTDHLLDGPPKCSQANGSTGRSVAVDAVAVHNEQRFCRIRGHLRLDDLAIRNTDRAWHMARCVLIGPADIDHDDARL